MEIIIFLAIVIAVILCIIILKDKSDSKKEEFNISRKNGEKRMFARRIVNWRKGMNDLESRFGCPKFCFAAYCNEVKTGDSVCNDVGVLFFEGDKKIVIISSFPNARILAEIPFDSITDIEVSYRPLQAKSYTTATKISLMDLTTKAAVGAFLFGSTGAGKPRLS